MDEAHRHRPLVWPASVLALLICTTAPLLSYVWTSSGFVLSGEHRHRQADTFAVARNFVDQPNFFYPRVDHRRGGTGIVQMEAPLVPYGLSLVFRLTGPDDAIARRLLLLFNITVLMLCLGPLSRTLQISSVSLAFGLLLSPMLLYYARQVQPDLPMFVLGTAAVTLAFSPGSYALVASALLFTAATVTKYSLIFFWPAWVYLLASSSTSTMTTARRVALALVPLLVLGLWLLWSARINETWDPVDASKPYFDTTIQLGATSFDILYRHFKHLALEVFAQHMWSLAAVPPLVLGTLRMARSPDRRLVRFIALWGLGFVVFFVLTQYKFRSHFYYALPGMLVVWWLGAAGLDVLWRAATESSSHGWPVRIVAAAVLVLAMFWGSTASLARIRERATPIDETIARPATFTALRDALVSLDEPLDRPLRTPVAVMVDRYPDPWWLHVAGRPGWVLHRQTLQPTLIQRLRRSGVRWMIIPRSQSTALRLARNAGLQLVWRHSAAVIYSL